PVAHLGLFMNPTKESGDPHPAVRAFARDSGFFRMRVTQLREHEDPDVDDDSDIGWDELHRAPLGLYDPAWVEKQRKKSGGEDSPLWFAYVRGWFAKQGVERRFVTRTMLQAAELADLF